MSDFEKFLLNFKKVIMSTAPSACICEWDGSFRVYVDTQKESVEVAGLLPLDFEGHSVTVRAVQRRV